MEVFDDNNGFDDQLECMSISHKAFYDSLRSLKGGILKKSLIQKSEEYLKNLNKRANILKNIYEIFSKQIENYCDNYVNEVNVIEEEDITEIKELKNDFQKMKDEIEKKKDKLVKGSVFAVQEPSFLYRENVKSKMNVELVEKHPGSYMYKEYMSKNRTVDGDIFIDCDGDNDELIVKYMKEDYSVIDDLKKLNLVKKGKLLNDLSYLELPIKKDFVKELGCNEDNEIMEAWKNRRVLVDGHYSKVFNDLLKTNNIFNVYFENEYIKNIKLDQQNESFYINLNMKFFDVIVDCLKNGKINKELIEANIGNGNADELMNEMNMIGIELSDDNVRIIRGCFDPRLLRGSTILLDTQYDKFFQEWLGNEYKWKLIYRASEHGYSAESFHHYCDDKGPTLVVIKSSGGWIFGGYTTQSWSGWGIYIMI